MEETRIVALDHAAESIAEVRSNMNRLRAEEAADMQQALRLMRQHGRTAYRHAGVELVRVPGEEKLRVRTSRDAATAESEPDEPGLEDGEFGEERAEAVREVVDQERLTPVPDTLQ
jgi:hypothetical protein